MGQRISFFKNNFNKGLKDLIFENFSAFRQWHLDSAKSSMEDLNEPYGNEILENYLHQENNLKKDFHKLDKRLIDELTAKFVADYCDTTDGEGKILEFLEPSVNKWRYEASTEMVMQTGDKDFVQFWNFLIRGRSLKDNADFDSYSNDFKIGFLTFDEHQLLKAKIELYFGNPEQLKHNFWTEEEKLKEQNAIKDSKNGTYSLSGHNPKSSGLENVLQVLNQMTHEKNELITSIE
ncbi:hypothetical protein SAMN04488522_101819 [Pedobacter caeni]|uniref:Uncharacterized protein n=2 Tax=Pedobacter caeni TaxID=288992 RepID=A0A1M4V8N6_9SPHI|nr:hypothetical protein SAMN04488522_101819 [Pedobacter caeni]